MIDRKIQNFDKKITQFADYRLKKVQEAQVAGDKSDVERNLKRAENEWDSLNKKLTKLREKFTDEELSGVIQHLEEQRKALRNSQVLNNDVANTKSATTDHTTDDVASETCSSKSHRAETTFSSENKDVKMFTRHLKNFESFELKDVRKKENDRLKAYLNEIDGANKKLTKLLSQFASLESQYHVDDLEELKATLSNYQDEMSLHVASAKKKQEEENYLSTRAKCFDGLTYYFSETADKHNSPHIIIQTCLNNDFTYTFADTQKLLEIENPDKHEIRRGQENYKRSVNNLNDETYIENYYLYLDNAIQYDSEKEKTLHTLYQAIALIKDSLLPDNEHLNNILYYIDKLKGQRIETQEKALSEIIVSDFHQNNLNKVFFTDQESKAVSQLTQSDMKTEFLPGESIRCIAFLNNSFENIYGKKNRPSFELVDNIHKTVTEEFTINDLNKGYIDFKLVTNGENYQFPSSAKWSSVEKVMQFFLALPPRKKIIQVKVSGAYYANGQFPEAKLIGELTIDGSDEEGKGILQNNLKLVKARVLANEKVPEAGMTNVAYENEIIKLFNGFSWAENFKKVIITSNDFFMLKNHEGIGIGRGLYVTLLSETSDGCYMQQFTVAQDPIGSDWTKFRLEARGHKSEISCDKIEN